jgi:hypothetical protein
MTSRTKTRMADRLAGDQERAAKAAETRRRGEPAPKARSTGVGDSRVFVDPDGPRDARTDLTVNGEPIPEHLTHLIPYEATDQGRVEVNAGKTEARAQVLRDPVDNKIAAFGDESLEPWQSPNPMKELADAHVGPGMRARFLSQRKCERDGMRGWKPVINPATGEPVKLGHMILGEMPEAKAIARNKHYEEQGAEDLREIYDEFNEKQTKLMRDAGIRDMGPLRPGELVEDDRTHEVDQIGLQQSRGNAATP